MEAPSIVDSDLFPAMLCRIQCPSCWAVLVDPSLLRPNKPCPECGAAGEARQTWPRLPVVQHLKIGQHFFASARDHYADETARVASRLGVALGREVSSGQARAAYRAFCSVYRATRDYEQLLGRLQRFFRCSRDASLQVVTILISGEFSSPEVIVVPLVVVSALESLLLALLLDLRLRVGEPYDKARAAVLRLRSFEQQIADFRNATGAYVDVECETAMPGFWGRLVRVRRERNKFVHSSPYATRVAAVLRLGALALRNSRTALGAALRRVARRKGLSVAIFATARKLAILYRMLRHGQDYVDEGIEAYEARFHRQRLATLRSAAQELGYELLPRAATA